MNLIARQYYPEMGDEEFDRIARDMNEWYENEVPNIIDNVTIGFNQPKAEDGKQVAEEALESFYEQLNEGTGTNDTSGSDPREEPTATEADNPNPY